MRSMKDVEREFYKILSEIEVPFSVFSRMMPEDIISFQRSVLGRLGTQIYISRTHAVKIPAILIHVFKIPCIESPIVDHAGLTMEHDEKAFEANLKLGFFESIGGGKYRITERCIKFSRENPIPEELVKIIDFLSSLDARELGWLTERLLSKERSYDGRWMIRLVSKGDFKDPYQPTLPRETILFNIYRFLIRYKGRTNPGPSVDINSEFHVEDLNTFLLKEFNEAGNFNVDLIDLKSFVGNRFVYIEAINIASVILGGSIPLKLLPYFVYDWIQYEEFTKKAKGESTDIELVKYLKKETEKDVKKLLKYRLLQQVDVSKKSDLFLLPSARCYVDSNDNYYYLWDSRVVKKRYEQIKEGWKKIYKVRRSSI